MVVNNPKHVRVPENFSIEPLSDGDRRYGLEMLAPDGSVLGLATVDESCRGYALGLYSYVKPGDYTGRGWQQRLYDDAVSAVVAAVDD